MREGWELKKLVDVCEKTSNINWKDNSDKTFQYIDLSAVSRDTLTITESSEINSLNAPSRAKKILNTNDVIFATTRPTLNRMAIIPPEYNENICSTGFTVLRAKKDAIDAKYIFYSLQIPDFMKRMEKMQRGASYPAVSDKDVKDFEIPVPPLKEQKQIVSTLNKAFKQIDQAKTNLEQNLHNAKELFQSKLNEVFSQRGEGWVEKKLGDVCTLYQGLAINKKTKHLLVEKSSIPLLRIKDLKKNMVEQYVSEVGYPENSFVTEDEIIYTRTGSLGLVFRGKRGVLHNNSFKVVPNKELSSNYLFWWLQHEAFTKIIISLASKAAQPDITHKLFKEQIISIPSLEMQNSYYLEIEQLNELSNKLQTHYQQKLNNLEELKKSILQKAFRGELHYS